MPQHTQLYIVASRHPRVGKTLLSRLLIEFLRISGRPLVGYDLDPREPAQPADRASFGSFGLCAGGRRQVEKDHAQNNKLKRNT